MGVCPHFEYDNIMHMYCLGYDYFNYGAFDFFMYFNCQFMTSYVISLPNLGVP